MGSRREFTRILGLEGFASRDRTWDDLPWAGHRVTLVYQQRRVCCQTCGVRTERVAFADPKARITRRLRQNSKWASARPIRSSRELADFLHPQALH